MIEQLTNYKENDLSKEIIIPLLKKIYQCDVDFSGGGIEKGRDIIIYNKSPIGFNEYIGVQVKKIKATPNSSINSFQQLMTQLEQMKNEGVVDQKTGSKVKLKTLFFITPYPISDRAYDSHQGAVKSLIEQGINIIHGDMLVELINQHTPELVRKLLGDKNYIGDKIKSKLSNEMLMSALNFKHKKNLCDIYCETQLIAGNKNNNILKRLYIPKNNKFKFKFKLNQFELLSESNNTLKRIINIELFKDEHLNNGLLLSSELKIINKNINSTQDNIDRLNDELAYKIAQSPYKAHYPSHHNPKDFSDFLNSKYADCDIKNDKLNFYEDVSKLNKIYNEKNDELEKRNLLRHEQSLIQSDFELDINSIYICEKINSLIGEINEISDPNKYGLKDYLITTETQPA